MGSTTMLLLARVLDSRCGVQKRNNLTTHGKQRGGFGGGGRLLMWRAAVHKWGGWGPNVVQNEISAFAEQKCAEKINLGRVPYAL